MDNENMTPQVDLFSEDETPMIASEKDRYNVARKATGSIGLKLGFFALIVVGAQSLITVIATALNSLGLTGLNTASADFQLMLTFVSVDIIGLLSIWLMLKGTPKTEYVIGHEKLSVKEYLLGITVCFASMVTGALIGNVFQFIAAGSSQSTIGTLAQNSGWLWLILAVGIGAPIVEELIFRKFIIDRLSGYGRFLAIFVSSLCFALFHGNFSQFFYAFFLGMFFGYIYSKTGNILYSMGYHMIVNMFGSVILVYVMQKAQSGDTFFGVLLSILIVAEYALTITGIVLLIVRRNRFRLAEPQGALNVNTSVKTAFTSGGIWLFYIVTIALFILGIYSSKNTSNPGEVVLTINHPETVVVQNGQSQNEPFSFEFRALEDGQYLIRLDWFESDDPGFVTGVALKSADGKVLGMWAGEKVKMDLPLLALTKGEYALEFTFLDSEQEFFEYSHKFCEDNGFEQFKLGDLPCFHRGDGSYNMFYKFGVYRVK